MGDKFSTLGKWSCFLSRKVGFSTLGEREIQNLGNSSDVDIAHLGIILGNELKKVL